MVGRAAAALLALALLAGCDTDCRLACRHMMDDCGVERPDTTIEDCTAQCSAFVAHYEDDWQADRATAAVACVRRATCDTLRSGTPCYDEAVYIW